MEIHNDRLDKEVWFITVLYQMLMKDGYEDNKFEAKWYKEAKVDELYVVIDDYNTAHVALLPNMCVVFIDSCGGDKPTEREVYRAVRKWYRDR